MESNEQGFTDFASDWGNLVAEEASHNPGIGIVGRLPDQKVTRTRKATPEREPEDEAGGVVLSYEPDELAPLLRIVSDICTGAAGVSPISEPDADELARAAAPVLSKYLGATVDRWGAEIGLVLISVKIYRPKVSEYIELHKDETEPVRETGTEERENF